MENFSSHGNHRRSSKIVLFAMSLLVLSACNRQLGWSGEYKGSAIERLEAKPNSVATGNSRVESKTNQNSAISLKRTSEDGAMLTFGSCSLLLVMETDRKTGYVREGQSCHVNFGGYDGEMLVHGNVVPDGKTILFILRGEAVEGDKVISYTFDFNGQTE